MPITGNTTFGEGDDFNLLSRGLLHEPLDGGHVHRFVARRVLKLNGGDADVAHGTNYSIGLLLVMRSELARGAHKLQKVLFEGIISLGPD